MSNTSMRLCGALADVFPDATHRQIKHGVSVILDHLEANADEISYPYALNLDRDDMQTIFEGVVRNLKDELL